jgi:hypothetical protein
MTGVVVDDDVQGGESLLQAGQKAIPLRQAFNAEELLHVDNVPAGRARDKEPPSSPRCKRSGLQLAPFPSLGKALVGFARNLFQLPE